MKGFCPKCGKDTDTLIDGLCQECFSQKGGIISLPREIAVEQCKKCGKIKHKGKWMDEKGEVLEKKVEEKMRVRGIERPVVAVGFRELDSGALKIEAVARGFAGEKMVSAKAESVLRKNPALCDSCMKLSSDYFEATVQVRFGEKKERKEIGELVSQAKKFLESMQNKDPLAQVVGVRDSKKGLDILVGSKRAGKLLAQKLARKSGGKIVASSSLVGVKKDGSPKKRFTFCARL